MSVVCGVKTTHDGCVALIVDGALVLSYEAEKTGNNPRHAALADVSVDAALSAGGIAPGDVDVFAIDGWAGERVVAPTPRVSGADGWLPVAPYNERRAGDPVLAERRGKIVFDGQPIEYVSYTHAAGHVAGTYCASPFAQRGEDAFVLAWDGGMSPRLYHAESSAAGCRITALGPLFALAGNVYPVLAAHLDPFRCDDEALAGEDIGDAELSLPGRAMAYAALGEVATSLLTALAEVMPAAGGSASRLTSFPVARKIASLGAAHRLDSASIIATFQFYLGQRLIAALADRLRQHDAKAPNLCFTGGCALNIAWNTALRSCGLFSDVWVPPFPNDAGSALGTAMAACIVYERRSVLAWNPYSGQPLRPSRPAPGWTDRACSLAELAGLLHETGEPVVFLNGRAELGPRALGNRSILCAATDRRTTENLNRIKGREWYRPVAPVCLASEAPRIFDPGTPDPYMLFTHRVRDPWRSVIPAVVHIDGTARLQTVTREQNPGLTTLLEAYERRSAIPVLCNTSANLKGCGFFPDVASATGWGRTRYVWSQGRLYERPPN